MVVSWPDLTASSWILKSRLWYSAFPAPLPLLRSLRLLTLLRLEDSEDSGQGSYEVTIEGGVTLTLVNSLVVTGVLNEADLCQGDSPHALHQV